MNARSPQEAIERRLAMQEERRARQQRVQEQRAERTQNKRLENIGMALINGFSQRMDQVEKGMSEAIQTVSTSTRYTDAQRAYLIPIMEEMRQEHIDHAPIAKGQVLEVERVFTASVMGGMPLEQAKQAAQQQLNAIQADHAGRIKQIVLRHGQQGDAARKAINEGLQHQWDGWLGRTINSATKLVYDSDKGGIQPGGLVGAIGGIALFMGLKNAGFLDSLVGEGNLLVKLAVGAIALLGFTAGAAQLGNSLAGYFGGRNTPTPAPGAAPGVVMTPSPAVPGREMAQGASFADLGGLKPHPASAPPSSPSLAAAGAPGAGISGDSARPRRG